jgi:hypothetical protein
MSVPVQQHQGRLCILLKAGVTCGNGMQQIRFASSNLQAAAARLGHQGPVLRCRQLNDLGICVAECQCSDRRCSWRRAAPAKQLAAAYVSAVTRAPFCLPLEVPALAADGWRSGGIVLGLYRLPSAANPQTPMCLRPGVQSAASSIVVGISHRLRP